MDPKFLEALERLETLIERAEGASIPEPDAATLSTVDREGRPSARMVLVRQRDPRGLAFFTNLRSNKSEQLRDNPWAALTFWWRRLGEQVHVQGRAALVSEAEADLYWQSRPREHQIGAWASEQSQPLERRAILEDRYLEYEKRFEGQEVPRPAWWSGYRVTPVMFEFWKWQPSRLHDRERYLETPEGWRTVRLYP